MPTQTTYISVIVTAYNMQDCLQECLSSLAAQSLSNFEAFIIEDGSIDNTAQIAESFAQRDSRFHVIHTPNIGAAGARNQGIKLVKSPYFMLLDGDDIFLPTMLETLYNSSIQTNADITVCDIVQFEHKSNIQAPAPWALKKSQLPNLLSTPAFSWSEIPGNLFAAFMGWPWDKLYRTQFIKQAGLTFPEDLPNSEDMLFTYKALVLAQRISVVPEVLIEHRINRGGSVSNSRTREPLAFYEGLCRMKQFLLDQPDDTWQKIQQPFLNWAFDWTLWNIETLPSGSERISLIERLWANELPALELSEHDASYYTNYPRSMARYASLSDNYPTINPNEGPLGPLDKLPYGEFKPWSQANFFEKIAIRKRMRKNVPTEW